jgi:peptide/nickel transport system ATP-binding protein
MAFACRPSLIVLDEPTTSLDVSAQGHVLDAVRGMCRSHRVSAVYVSHDLAVVSGLVSEVAVMYAGRIVEIGSAARLFREPVHPYSRGLIGAVPSVDRAEVLAGIDGQQPQPGRRGAGCSFASRCGHAIGECTIRTPEPVSIDGRAVRCLRARDIRAVTTKRALAATYPPATADEPVLLSAHGVSASYGSRPVLFDVGLDVPPQACVAVVGESGSGKTTFALHRRAAQQLDGRDHLPGHPRRQGGAAARQGNPAAGPVHLPESVRITQPQEDGRPDRGAAT